ncbi:MAG: hypothetical protein LUQ07_06715 [Methanospirillum sp.]|nr:hypothetical protein [Methanospirillum sp.]
MIIHNIRSDYLAAIFLVAVLVCTSLASGNPVGKPYITIDPVDSTPVGDLVILSGTTDLAEGTELFVRIQDGGYNSGAVILKGTNGINRWSVPVDTSVIKPGDYLVNVTEKKGLNQDKTGYEIGNTSASARVILTGTFLGSDNEVSGENQKNAFIAIDPLNNRDKGDQFLITGKTNLQVGTMLLWEVTPAYLEQQKSGTFTGTVANSQVTRGTGSNLVTFALDTNFLNPGEYNVTVSTIRGEIFSDRMVPGNISGSAVFTLK